MKNEFVLAFNEVLEEKGLPKEVIVKALESAMVSAYRRAVNASNAQQVEAKIDLETGKVTIFADKEVVDQVQDPRTEVTLAEARRYNPDADLGQMVVVESTPRDFGRVAAQTARQVIQQRIRDAERQAQLSFYDKQIGEIVSGIVQAVNAQGLTIGLEMRAEGTMPRKEMIPGERFRVHDRVRALLAEVKDTPRGPQIILSRTHRNFLRRLLENEVPEIYHGIVEIRSIAREPGERAKVAVYATQQGIDPVGACVGIRGVRIQAIVRELHDEKIVDGGVRVDDRERREHPQHEQEQEVGRALRVAQTSLQRDAQHEADGPAGDVDQHGGSCSRWVEVRRARHRRRV